MLDCGSTGSRLHRLADDRSHVVDVDEKITPAVHVRIAECMTRSSVETTAKAFANRVAMAIRGDGDVVGVRAGAGAGGVSRRGGSNVFVGMTAGVRNWVRDDPRPRRSALQTFLRVVREALRRHDVVVTWESSSGYMSARRESQYEHAAMRDVVARCISPHPQLKRCLHQHSLVGHIGVGGASIQVSWRDAPGPSGTLQHRLLPFSFTTPDAIAVADAYFDRRRQQRSRERPPTGVYFLMESCYWVVKEIVEKAAARGERRPLSFDACTPLPKLVAALARFEEDEGAKPVGGRDRNYTTACLLRRVLEHVLPSEATVVVAGPSYCGADITWALGRLRGR